MQRPAFVKPKPFRAARRAQRPLLSYMALIASERRSQQPCDVKNGTSGMQAALTQQQGGDTQQLHNPTADRQAVSAQQGTAPAVLPDGAASNNPLAGRRDAPTVGAQVKLLAQVELLPRMPCCANLCTTALLLHQLCLVDSASQFSPDLLQVS